MDQSGATSQDFFLAQEYLFIGLRQNGVVFWTMLVGSGRSRSPPGPMHASFGESRTSAITTTTADYLSTSRPERAGFSLLRRTCAASSMGGFANQPDDVLFDICVILAQFVIHWSAQIREDPDLRDNFHHFIDELSGIGL
jgi:hypothetical protein